MKEAEKDNNQPTGETNETINNSAQTNQDDKAKTFSTAYQKIEDGLTKLLQDINKGRFATAFLDRDFWAACENAFEELFSETRQDISSPLPGHENLLSAFDKKNVSNFFNLFKGPKEKQMNLYEEARDLVGQYHNLKDEKKPSPSEMLKNIKKKANEEKPDKTVGDQAQEASKSLKNKGKKVLESAREGIQTTAKSAKKEVKKAGKSAGKQIKRGAKAAGEGLKKAAKSTTKQETEDNVQKSGFLAKGVRRKNITTILKNVGITVAAAVIGGVVLGPVGALAALVITGAVCGYRAYSQIKKDTAKFDHRASVQNNIRSSSRAGQELAKSQEKGADNLNMGANKTESLETKAQDKPQEIQRSKSAPNLLNTGGTKTINKSSTPTQPTSPTFKKNPSKLTAEDKIQFRQRPLPPKPTESKAVPPTSPSHTTSARKSSPHGSSKQA